MNTSKVIGLVAAASAWLVLTPVASAQEQVGVNAAIRNSVQTRNGTSGALRPAQLRAGVRLGDQFVTGANSQVQVLLRDRSTFTVGANARMTVDRFVVGSGGGASVARGAFRFASGSTSRSASSRQAVSTPVASIGVRGTIVEGVVGPDARAILNNQSGVPPFSGDDETAVLIVLRGPSGQAYTFDTPGGVDVEGGGRTVVLDRPGQALIVTDSGSFGPFFLPDDVSSALVGLLTPPAGAGADPGGAEGDFAASAFTEDNTFPGLPLPQTGPGDVFEPTSGERGANPQSPGDCQSPSGCAAPF
ncbi:hypothetical protein GVN24_27885 [Rhizobium sp. CRIBSB]|nr:hypothetical protein [Rhizobium sp. CRIBSB]